MGKGRGKTEEPTPAQRKQVKARFGSDGRRLGKVAWKGGRPAGVKDRNPAKERRQAGSWLVEKYGRAAA